MTASAATTRRRRACPSSRSTTGSRPSTRSRHRSTTATRPCCGWLTTAGLGSTPHGSLWRARVLKVAWLRGCPQGPRRGRRRTRRPDAHLPDARRSHGEPRRRARAGRTLDGCRPPDGVDCVPRTRPCRVALWAIGTISSAHHQQNLTGYRQIEGPDPHTSRCSVNEALTDLPSRPVRRSPGRLVGAALVMTL